MSALTALAAAKAAGVKLTLDGDGIILNATVPPLPADLVDILKAVKPDLMRILEWREAARATLAAGPPPDCLGRLGPPGDFGVRRLVWDVAIDGLRRFAAAGWADKACLMGWTKEELYRVPPLWARIDLCGAALLIGNRRVIAITSDNIIIETVRAIRIKTANGGVRTEQVRTQTKFRRLGREHIA
jgi:hypothetical protein